MQSKKKHKNNDDIRIVKTGFISKEELTQTKIIFALFDCKTPLSNKEIANQTKITKPLASRNIKKLVKMGIVIPVSNGSERTYYTLQPFMVDDKRFGQILTNVEQLAKGIGKSIIVNYTDELFEQILRNNTLALLSMLKMLVEQRN